MVGIRLRGEVLGAAIEPVRVDGLDDVAPFDGPGERDARAAGIKTRAAPFVVGIVRVGAEDQKNGRVAAGIERAHDKESVTRRFGSFHALGPEGDLVKTGTPITRDRQREAGRPVAPARIGVGRNRVLDASNAAPPPDDLPRDADTRDLDRKGRRPGRTVEGHLLARLIA